jgi:hemerythrin-like domain-containing protein
MSVAVARGSPGGDWSPDRIASMRMARQKAGTAWTHDPEETFMSTDAIVLLRAEHQQIRKAFRAFRDAGEAAEARKGQLMDRIIELLTIHTYIENEVMYPRVRALLPDLEDDVLESYEEHHVADVLVMELAGMEPSDERFPAKATVLIESVEHHMEEEEHEWFPPVRQGLGRRRLQEIGAEIIERRKEAPHRPSEPGALRKVVKAVTG